jgi:1-acyl-sn-glycerol-3-phosphate acyltransferase
MLRIILKGIFHFLAIIIYRPKIVGKENVPEKGGCIICPNHVHALDSVIILTGNKRKVCFMAKEELFKNGFIKFLAKVFTIFPVRRGGKDLEAIKTSLRILKKGDILAMFPEGTRNGMAKGQGFKSGAILIAIKAGVPIIPCGVQGSFKPFTKVKLNYGKPIYYDPNTDLQNKENIAKLSEELMNEVVRLRDEKI